VQVVLVRWNPVARHVIASVSYDNTVRVWDAAGARERMCFPDHPDSIQSFDWNYNGSLYATYCKDKQARLVDPRNNAVAATFPGHQGTKGARVSFLGDRPMFVTVGFSKQSERQLFFWDVRDETKPLTEVQIDIASGALLPFFDPDTSLLYLGGKGDTNIRYFEIDDAEPHQYFLSHFQGKGPQRGLCMVPRRALDVDNNEVRACCTPRRRADASNTHLSDPSKVQGYLSWSSGGARVGRWRASSASRRARWSRSRSRSRARATSSRRTSTPTPLQVRAPPGVLLRIQCIHPLGCAMHLSSWLLDGSIHVEVHGWFLSNAIY
jgi:hypothetical protein